MLDDLGLLPSLNFLFNRIQTQSGLAVNFTHGGIQQRLPPEVESTSFRIIQEALTNVNRYAGVRNATVNVINDGRHIIIEVEDKGFDLDDKITGRTLGLTSMRERAKLLGGRFDIETKPGKGTKITVEIPITAAPV